MNIMSFVWAIIYASIGCALWNWATPECNYTISQFFILIMIWPIALIYAIVYTIKRLISMRRGSNRS